MQCKTCKHWVAPDRDYMEGFGKCKGTPEQWDYKRFDAKGEIVGDPSITALVEDGSAYYAGLLTRPEHYCSMYSKVNQEVA